MKELSTLLQQLQGALVLCVGDIILDKFVYGEASRLSPEAPIAVVVSSRTVSMPGGMGNVVRNLGELGALPLAVSVAGCDENAFVLANLFMQSGRMPPIMIQEEKRPTIVKTRIVAGGQQIVRVDEERVAPLGESTEDKLIAAVRRHLSGVGAIAISDYGKGVVSPRVASEIIAFAKERHLPVVVDPKGEDYAKYAGATLITPNRKELSEASGKSLRTEQEIIDAAETMIRKCGIERMLVTRSEEGMTLVSSDGSGPLTFTSMAREVADISGAGDTVVAAMTASLAAGASVFLGAKLATLAAGVVVGKRGTAIASPEEIEALAAVCGDLFPDVID